MQIRRSLAGVLVLGLVLTALPLAAQALIEHGAPLLDILVPGAGGIAFTPIPAAVWLFGSGLLGLIAIARRRKSA